MIRDWQSSKERIEHIMIFLSYASEDRKRVEPYYDLLNEQGHDPWMDSKRLVGGENWDYEIKTALDRSEIIVVFVSKHSVDKRGYAQREISLALNKHEEKLVDDIFIIPVQLDNGEYPHLLKGIQFIRESDGNTDKALLASIEKSKGIAKEQAKVAQETSEVHWSVSESKSSYDGIPGYETKIEKIRLLSARYDDIDDISEHINGTLVGFAMDSRDGALTPSPDLFNLLQDKWQRTNTFDGILGSVSIVGRVISVTYSLHWYNAGAAHPVHAPKTFNYLLSPVHHIKSIRTLFQGDEALEVLQKEVCESLVANLYHDNFGDADLKWIREGTQDWASFSNFDFTEEGILFQFGSYQVACYAAGMPAALVSYEKVLPHLTDTFVFALNQYRR